MFSTVGQSDSTTDTQLLTVLARVTERRVAAFLDSHAASSASAMAEAVKSSTGGVDASKAPPRRLQDRDVRAKRRLDSLEDTEIICAKRRLQDGTICAKRRLEDTEIICAK